MTVACPASTGRACASTSSGTSRNTTDIPSATTTGSRRCGWATGSGSTAGPPRSTTVRRYLVTGQIDAGRNRALAHDAIVTAMTQLNRWGPDADIMGDLPDWKAARAAVTALMERYAGAGSGTRRRRPGGAGSAPRRGPRHRAPPPSPASSRHSRRRPRSPSSSTRIRRPCRRPPGSPPRPRSG